MRKKILSNYTTVKYSKKTEQKRKKIYFKGLIPTTTFQEECQVIKNIFNFQTIQIKIEKKKQDKELNNFPGIDSKNYFLRKCQIKKIVISIKLTSKMTPNRNEEK